MSKPDSDDCSHVASRKRSVADLDRAGASALIEAMDSHVIVAVTDAKGLITYANELFCEISEYSRSELLGQSHRIINSGYHPKAFWKKFWATIKAGKIWKGQICNKAKSGRLYWVQTTIYPVVKEGGRIDQFVAFRTDITPLKDVENKLRQSQMHMQEASRVAKLGSWELDLVAQKLNWSWTTKVIHEVPPDYEPDLESGLQFYPEGEMRDRIATLVQRGIEHGEPFDAELQIRAFSGRVKWVRAIGHAEMLEGQCIRLYGVFQDIDEERRQRERSEQNASLLGSIVEGATEFGVIATDKTGMITLFNAGAERILGYRASELVGKETPAVIHLMSEVEQRAAELSEEFGDQVEGFETFVKVANLKGSERREWTYVTKSGGRVPVSLVVTPLRAPSGEHTGYLGISQDLSAQKQAESVALESDARFRKAFQFSGIGMAVVSLEGRFLQVNESMVRMFGYSEEAFASMTIKEVTHPEDVSLGQDSLGEMVEGTRQSFTLEKRYLDFDGEVIWARLDVAVVRDPQRAPLYFVCQILNITESKTFERKMREAHDRLELAARAGGVGIWDFDVATGRLVWDEVMFSLYGVDPERFEAGYEDWEKALHPDDVEDTVAKIEAALAGTEEFDTEFRMVRADNGEVRHLRGLASVERNEAGEAVRMVGTNWDVTDQVMQKQALVAMADEAKEANRAKSQFLANMSHEIRTPINGVIGMTGLLLDSPDLNAVQRKQAGVIQSSGEALLSVINDILDFSKIEAGKLDLEILDFGLRDTLDDLKALLAQRVQEKRLEFVCSADPDVPNFLRGDAGRLRQILLNLAGNAIKFTESGHVKVHVSLEERGDREATLRFEVTDTGIGIRQDKQKNLFREFTQADASTTRMYGGTGLGLAICKQLVRLMGGQIRVESEFGKGSVFWFTVPFPFGQRKLGESDECGLEGRAAMVVAARKGSRSDLRDRLQEWGITVDAHSNAGDALGRLHELERVGRKIDYVVFDLEGSDVNAAHFAEGVGGIESSAGALRVVVSKRAPDEKWSSFSPLLSPYRRSELYNLLMGEKESHDAGPKASDLKELAGARFGGLQVRLLVAEDNIVNQMVVRGILSKFGLQADTVANGREAVEALSRIPYDLVLMDIQMPEMDGLEASRRIREGEAGEAAKEVPIVALTAHARTEDRQECLDAGMNEYASKPVVPEGLYCILEKLLPSAKGTPSLGGAGVSQAADSGVFDRAKFISGMMDDESLAREIATLSLVDLRKHSEGLEESFKSGSQDELLRAAHSIKGVSAHACCYRLRAEAERLENGLRNGEEDMVRGSYESFSRLLLEGMSALQGFLDEDVN